MTQPTPAQAKEAFRATAWPRPQLLDAAFGTGANPELIPDDQVPGCLEMLEAGWVPDSIGKPGLPDVGVRKDPVQAAVLRNLLLAHRRRAAGQG